MRQASRHGLVLGIFPNTRGFAFALFEGPLAPVDWGIIRIRGKNKNRRCLRRIARLFGQYAPDVVVLQDMSEGGTQRARRIRSRNEAIEVLAGTQDIQIFTYSRSRVRQCFAMNGLRSRHAMAEAIAKHIPMFKRFLPPVRKIWMTEDPRIGLFEAIGLILVFYQSHTESYA